MRLSNLLLTLARFFLPPAVLGTLYLYFYPVILNCAFPPARRAADCTDPATSGAYFVASRGETAPFRLLALGDPQLEGDTSLHKPETWLGGFKRYRKRLDLWGNDLYLAHVYRSVRWWTQPTHEVVLGDLVGSQWIGDEEFQRRGERFWGTVFSGAKKGVDGEEGGLMVVAGNHDIGYAGDVDEGRVRRFEEVFGKVNWSGTVRLDGTGKELVTNSTSADMPELRLVILNSMNLDEPALDQDLRHQTLDFLDQQLSAPTTAKTATVLLTHIPLHKPPGLCADGPFFDYFPTSQGGGIKEQNHLSPSTSSRILSGLTSEMRPAIILNGHDHEGCDTSHSYDGRLTSAGPEGLLGWQAEPHTSSSSPSPGIVREITVRSMMGSYGGNAGMLSGWFDEEAEEWRFEYATCVLGVQHIWWAVHILDLVVLGMGVVGFWALVAEEVLDQVRRERAAEEAKKNA